MNFDALFNVLGACTILAPVVLFSLMGLTMLVNWPLSERTTARWTQAMVFVGLTSALAVLALMLFTGRRNVSLEGGNFVVIAPEHFHFHLDFMFDRLSVPFAILSFVLVGTIGAFANHYLHREPGFRRFFLLYAMFLVGMIVASLAGTIETLFFGWELVGLSSALLVAFFHERPSPVLNGQRVWSVYRIADAAFLIAAVVLHHLKGEGDFDGMMGSAARRRLAGRRLRALIDGRLDCRPIATSGRGRQVRVDSVLRLATARDGRPDSFERRVLWRALGPSWRLPAVARQSVAGRQLLVERRGRGARTFFGRFRRLGCARAD
jgi:hypothetical protein